MKHVSQCLGSYLWRFILHLGLGNYIFFSTFKKVYIWYFRSCVMSNHFSCFYMTHLIFFLFFNRHNYANNNYMEVREKEFYFKMGEPRFFQSDYVPCNIGEWQCGFHAKLPSSSNSYMIKNPRPHLWRSVGRTRRVSFLIILKKNKDVACTAWCCLY